MLIIYGEPIGKARPRFGNGRAYTPKKTADYEKTIRKAWKEEKLPKDIPVRLTVHAYYSIAKSDSKRKQDEKRNGLVQPIKKPDLDNVVKIIADALNGKAWEDDCQIIAISAFKHYSDMPRVEVEVSEYK